MSVNLYNIQNKLCKFIVIFLKTQDCKKIFVKIKKDLFIFEINIQLKNEKWIAFSIIYEIPNNLYIFNDNSYSIIYIKQDFQKYLNKNKKYLRLITQNIR